MLVCLFIFSFPPTVSENVREFHSDSHGNAFVCEASVLYCVFFTFLAPLGDWIAWLGFFMGYVLAKSFAGGVVEIIVTLPANRECYFFLFG